MQLPRFVGIADLGIATVIAVLVVLPPREMYASSVIKGDEAAQLGLALAEARTIARPGDGAAVGELQRRLDEANQKDWAIDASVAASDRAKDSPTRWRALIAASTAFVDRLDVKDGLDFANRALGACDNAGPTDCPAWEQVRMQLYHDSLKAGVDLGIDPRRDPRGFRKAGENVLHEIHLNRHDIERPSGSAGSQTAHPDPADSSHP